MKKIIIISVFVLLASLQVNAQTTGQFTMWNQNHFIVNPAAAGNMEYLDAAIGYRRQWAGIKEAPSTFYGTAHTVLNRPKRTEVSSLRGTSSAIQSTDIEVKKRARLKHAAGVMLNTSEFGAFKKSEFAATYALHLPITREVSLSFGLSAGLNNFGFDESKTQVIESNDPIYNSYFIGQNQNLFNVNSGVYLYSDRFFVGYSANQILQNKLELSELKSAGDVTAISMHHFIMAGYNYDLNNDVRITPSILAKKLKSNPLSIDFSATVTYRQAMYVGLTYRTTDAISIMGGYQFSHLLRAGYAYDYTLSELREVSSGSHEVFIGFTLF
ncbi:MAG: type IX secretion system PorP/SprF family membrane protein [Vicingaceae bacterium]|jgi:type IX secretion system PorP/SprF family membrane protein